MSRHMYSYKECTNHTCDTCRFEENTEVPCVCCHNNSRDNENCYWEFKNNELNNEFKFHEYTEKCRDHDCENCANNLVDFNMEPCKTCLENHKEKYPEICGWEKEKIEGEENIVISILKRITSEQRLEIFSHFCTKCGAEKLQCSCGWH